MGKLLCALGLHKWLRIYEDDLESFYSCRRSHGACPATFVIEKGHRPEATA